ncbi:MAG: prephenate dehydratase [Burkholderiaceae bacterium]
MNKEAQSADSSADDDALNVLRDKIDSVDRQMQSLLQSRARLAHEVGEVKARTNAPVYRPEREASIFRRLREQPSNNEADLLKGAALESIYREVISACREVERRMRIAYLGPEGTFSEQAVLKHFGHGVEPMACASIDEVFRATEAGTAEFGVVPMENSTEGAVNRTLDLLLQSSVTISGEVLVPVEHCLMNSSGQVETIERVGAHPQALAQCARWLDQNLPNAERVPVSSNAAAARDAATEPDLAAIAGASAAARYDLQIVRQGIQDDPGNRTRFAVIGEYVCGPSGQDQTSLILSVPDEAGAVHRLIEPLARHGVSMKRFESRPARQRGWEYFFYIDLLGHAQDPLVMAALDEIRGRAAYYKLVGSYPRSAES